MKFTLYQPEYIYELGRRSNQEDSLFPAAAKATADDRIFVVCDGMGGHEFGEVASSIVCETIAKSASKHQVADNVFTDDHFQQVLDEAYDALDDSGKDKKGMGTTLAMLVFHRGGCLSAHIGDSRIYHFRPATGEILYRSRDHSLVNQLYETGEISRREMRTSKKKNLLLRAMQPQQPARTVADLVHITDIKPGDYFLMCTDGMLERYDDDDLLDILTSDADDKRKIELLREGTARNADNHTCYLIHVETVQSEPGDDRLPSDEAEARAACRALNDTSPGVDVELADIDEEAEADDSAQTSFVGEDFSNELAMEAPSLKRGMAKWLKILFVVLFLLIFVVAVLKFLH